MAEIERYYSIAELAQPTTPVGEERKLPKRGEGAPLLPFSKVHIYRLMAQGRFPKPVKLGERRVAWRESDILAWLEERQRASRAA